MNDKKTPRDRNTSWASPDNSPYYTFFMTAPAPFAVIDTKGDFLECNQAFIDLTGYSRSELLALNHQELVATQCRNLVADILTDTAPAKRENDRYEVAYQHKSGEIFVVVLYACASLDQQDNLAGFFLFVLEPNVDNRAHSSGPPDKNILQTVFDQSAHLIGILKPDGTILRVNLTALDILRAREKDLLGRFLWEIPGCSYTEDEQECIMDAVHKASQGEPVRFEFFHQDPDNKMHCLDFSLKPIFDNNGKVALLVSDGRNIDEYKKAQYILQKNERLLSDIIDFLPDPTFVINNQGIVIAWNKALEEITGAAAVDMIGQGNYAYAVPFYGESRPMLINFVLQDRVEIQRQCKQCKWIGNTLVVESFIPKLYKGKGAEVWSCARVLRDAGGQIIGAIESMRDISQRKEAEEENIKLKMQLAHAQKMEALGTLAGGIAHDFNNILCLILGNTDIAALKVLENECVKEELEEIMQAGLRARELVDQILTFSRKSEIIKKPIEIKPIIKEAAKFIRVTLPSSIEIREELYSVGKVFANPTQIHQIIMNLSTNASHAMRDKGGVLTIMLKETLLDGHDCLHTDASEAGRYVQLSVIDTGCGMSEEVLNCLFDPFFTTKTVGNGTGIGLSVVHGIVRSMDGFIRVESAAGQGSVFKVFLPVYGGEIIMSDTIRNDVKRGSQKILFVDDEPGVLSSVHNMLELYGYDVTCAPNAFDALEIFYSSPESFNLVLTDFIMPKMDGVHLARKIRDVRPEIPILLYTGFSNELSIEQLREFDITLVMKPLLANELAEIIFNKTHCDNR